MRPKRVVLCVHFDPKELSIRKFLLVTRGFRVLAAGNSADAVQLFAANAVDISIVDWGAGQMADTAVDEKDGDALIVALKAIKPHVPTILTSSALRSGEQSHHADSFLSKDSCTPAEIVERIRIMAQRKRGPRKPTFYQQPVNRALEVA